MAYQTVLVTGASGEMGHALITALLKRHVTVVATDIRPLTPELAAACAVSMTGAAGDITSRDFIHRAAEFPFDCIFHLAAVLSTAAERDPVTAHRINVEGTLNVLELAQMIGRIQNQRIRVLFPSTIAVYGFATLDEKLCVGKVREDQFLQPTTMYGIAKLHCERLGVYYSSFYRQLSDESSWVDFRAIRFPGLISAETVPSGGTSDYAPEMLHAAARGESYQCFVRPDTQIPFMAMPDGIKALLMLADAPEEKLSQRVYNIGAFAPAAQEIAETIKSYFPKAHISYAVDMRRQAIVDSWCADVDDSAARRDWGWQPDYDYHRAFAEYLIPAVRRRYVRVEQQ